MQSASVVSLRAEKLGAHELKVTRQFNSMLDQVDQLMADIRRAGKTTPRRVQPNFIKPD